MPKNCKCSAYIKVWHIHINTQTLTHTHTHGQVSNQMAHKRETSTWICKKGGGIQPLFEFHLKFVSHSTYLSENIYLSHIRLFSHSPLFLYLSVSSLYLSVFIHCMQLKCNGVANYFVSVCKCLFLVSIYYTHIHTCCAWLESI